TNRTDALVLVDTTALMRQPGDTFVYSDLGAIVLMQAVEAASGQPIDRFLETRLFGPLNTQSTRYRAPESCRSRIAPTENDTAFQHRVLWGEVHDENAGRLGGVSEHAGLFSSAPDLATFTRWLLRLRRIDSMHVREFTHRQDIPPGSSRALGWDTPSNHSIAGAKRAPTAYSVHGSAATA